MKRKSILEQYFSELDSHSVMSSLKNLMIIFGLFLMNPKLNQNNKNKSLKMSYRLLRLAWKALYQFYSKINNNHFTNLISN